jgi:deazaflavin-dependent oxidoreductase (nitroreductase family)
MKLSRPVARFNRLINNPIQGVYAWLVPPWAVIFHRGRRSGRQYRTPLIAFKHDRTLIIALLYGEESQWRRNLEAAGGGHVVRGGRAYKVGVPCVIDTDNATVLRTLSAPNRTYCRLADKQVILEIRGHEPGFGPRPHLL